MSTTPADIQCLQCGVLKPASEFFVKGRRGKESVNFRCRCRDCDRNKQRAERRVSSSHGRIANVRGSFTPNRHRIILNGSCAAIELTDRKGDTICDALVSIADMERVLSAGRWHAEFRNHTAYVGRSYRKDGKARVEWLHRFLLPECPAEMVIDHKNGNGLDNRQDNLRIATRSENQQNRRSVREKGLVVV